jgi:hypothetical protein
LNQIAPQTSVFACVCTDFASEGLPVRAANTDVLRRHDAEAFLKPFEVDTGS